jgi:hypothetical protein
MARINWQIAMDDFVQNPVATYESVAAKHRVSVRTLERHAQKEGWRTARQAFAWEVREKCVQNRVLSAAQSLNERSEKQLKTNESLRSILNYRLMIRRPNGEIVVNGDVTVSEVCKAVTAHCELYRCDRLALGADVLPATPPPDRFSGWTEEELNAELERIRREEFAEATDSELAKLGLARKKSTIQ